MRVQKVMWYDLVCPKCGSKITAYPSDVKAFQDAMKFDEYDDIPKILCMHNDVETEYAYIPCPVCGETLELYSIPDNSTDELMVHAANCSPFYCGSEKVEDKWWEKFDQYKPEEEEETEEC